MTDADRTTAMDRNRLAAFADGGLSPEEAAAVVMHLADHPEDQAFVDDLMASNALLVRAFSGPSQEPVPERFRAIILPEEGRDRTADVIPFRRRLHRSLPALAGFGAAAAAVLAGVAVLMRLGEARLALRWGRFPKEAPCTIFWFPSRPTCPSRSDRAN